MYAHLRRWLAPLALALVIPPALASHAAPPLLPRLLLEDGAAEHRGWVRHRFALGAPALDFSTLLPADVRIETSPLPDTTPLADDSVAALRIVAKILPAPGGAPMEGTVTVFHLPTAAAAGPVCQWLLEEAGYEITASTSTEDLAAAQALGRVDDANGKRERGALTACFARGDRLLTLTFAIDYRSAASDEQRRQWRDAGIDLASGALSNLRFTDGQPAAHAASQLARIPARIGDRDLGLVVPHAWNVRINDFEGKLPAELHLTRSADHDSRGALWLAAIPTPRQPTPQQLTAMGMRLFPDYLRAQTSDLRTGAAVIHGVDPALQQRGIASQQFRFPVTARDGNSGGDLIGVLAWHDNTVYALSLWSRVGPSTQRNAFFTRLPGLTAYDMLHAALARYLAGD